MYLYFYPQSPLFLHSHAIPYIIHKLFTERDLNIPLLLWYCTKEKRTFDKILLDILIKMNLSNCCILSELKLS